MRKLTLSELKNSKFYYVGSYRQKVKLLQYSLYLIMIEIVILTFMYLTRPEPLYFATNSASAIKPLDFLMEANYSSQALLPPDFPEELGIKQLTVE